MKIPKTDPRYNLWQKIRCRRVDGLRFVRFERFADAPGVAADFYCASHNVAVLVSQGQSATETLQSIGLSVVETSNEEVVSDYDAVVSKIRYFASRCETGNQYRVAKTAFHKYKKFMGATK